MRITVSLFLCILFSACISIEINSTGAKNLSNKERNQLRPFAERGSLLDFNQQAPVNLYMISGEDISTIINENKLVWIHKWRPFCNAESCQRIAPFQDKAKSNNVQLAFIAETADLDDINKAVKNAQFSSPIYFGNHIVYGTNITKARNKMKMDLLRNQMTNKQINMQMITFT